MAEQADDWKALAWAGLGRVKMLAGDFNGAGRALDFACEETAGTTMAPWVELEVRRVEGALGTHQGRFDQATAALDRAVELGRELSTGDSARALSVAERLELASLLGDAEAGLELCHELEALVELAERAVTTQRAAGSGELAGAPAGARPRHGQWEAGVRLRIRLLAQIGTRAEIAAALPALRRAVAGLRYGIALRLAWLEGHTAGAEAVWRQARDSFVEVDDGLWVARTTLDLARLCLAEERPGEATALASELATALEATATDPGDPATLEPLRRAAPFTEVTSGDLEAAESVLKRLEWQRRAARALDLAM